MTAHPSPSLISSGLFSFEKQLRRRPGSRAVIFVFHPPLKISGSLPQPQSHQYLVYPRLSRRSSSCLPPQGTAARLAIPCSTILLTYFTVMSPGSILTGHTSWRHGRRVAAASVAIFSFSWPASAGRSPRKDATIISGLPLRQKRAGYCLSGPPVSF